MRIFLIIICIWLLINVLLAVVTTPARKSRERGGSRSDGGYVLMRINKETYPFNEKERTTLRQIIMSVGLGVSSLRSRLQ